MRVSLPALTHVGLVVADLDAAAADFRRQWGTAIDHVVELTHHGAIYRGAEIDLTARYGFIRTGGSDVELIEPISTPSPYADFLSSNGGDGVHHLAYFVDAIDPYLEQLAEHRASAVLQLDAPLGEGERFVYVEGASHGPAVELIQVSQATLERMAAGTFGDV